MTKPATKLAKCGLIHTPKSQEELSEWICSVLPKGQRHIGHTIMLMTWNLCAEITNPESYPERELTPNERGEWVGDECSLKFY